MRISPCTALGALFCFYMMAAHAADEPADKQAKPKRAGNDCVFYSALYDWQGLDDRSLVVWVPGKRDAYRVELSMPLMGLRHEHTLGFVDGNNDGRLCSFGRDAITTGDRTLAQRSTIMAIYKLDAAELAQLEAKYKVKLTPESKRKAPPKEPDRQNAE